jgi:hypothetical protein
MGPDPRRLQAHTDAREAISWHVSVDSAVMVASGGDGLMDDGPNQGGAGTAGAEQGCAPQEALSHYPNQ